MSSPSSPIEVATIVLYTPAEKSSKTFNCSFCFKPLTFFSEPMVIKMIERLEQNVQGTFFIAEKDLKFTKKYQFKSVIEGVQL